MTRYILIENHSGYIWGDVEASSPAEAAREIDEGFKCFGSTYEEHGPRYRGFNSQDGVMFAYVPPAGFPEIDDGQSRALIERVESECDLVAVVTSNDPTAV